MSCNWPVTTLGEFASLFTGFPFKSNHFSEIEGTKLLRGDNVAQGTLRWENVKLWENDNVIEKHSNYLLKKGDVILAMDRPWIEAGLKFSQIEIDDLPCYLVQRVACLRAKDDEQNFLKFIIGSRPFTEYIKRVQTGTAVPHISGKQILAFEFRLPPKTARITIGETLSNIDCKISVNTRANQTLEQMAQAIFKSWFVDFDPVKAKMNGEQPEGMDAPFLSKEVASLFPEKLVESELGLIPDGWDIKSIKDFGKVVTGKTPPQKVEDAYAEQGVPFVTPSDIDSDVFVSETKRFLSESGVEVVKKNLLPEGSICVTCIGSQMGKAVISPSLAISNQQINSVVVAKEYERNFLFLNLRRRREEIFLIGSSGSTMPIINKSTFEKLAVLTPSEALIQFFDKAVSALLNKIHQNALENQTLSALRDTLLPKLLSGEIELGVK